MGKPKPKSTKSPDKKWKSSLLPRVRTETTTHSVFDSIPNEVSFLVEFRIVLNLTEFLSNCGQYVKDTYSNFISVNDLSSKKRVSTNNRI